VIEIIYNIISNYKDLFYALSFDHYLIITSSVYYERIYIHN